MGVFLTNLVAYAKSQWNLRKEDWDTARSYLMRVHQECAAGLGLRAGQGLARMVCVGGLDRSKASTEWARKSMGSMGWKALTISFGRGVEVDLWAGRIALQVNGLC